MKTRKRESLDKLGTGNERTGGPAFAKKLWRGKREDETLADVKAFRLRWQAMADELAGRQERRSVLSKKCKK